MFFTQGIYDLDELARFNLHIHTSFSGCAKAEMSVENILTQAQLCGLEMIALTDHTMYFEDDFFKNSDIIRQKVQKINPNIKVLIGGEFSSYGVDKYTLKNKNVKTDYRLYSQNHYHVSGWEHPKDPSPNEYKKLTKAMLRTLFENKAADTIAHPITDKYLAPMLGWQVGTLGNVWGDDELFSILKEGHNSGCAWELNFGAVMCDPDLARRIYNIGKECGVVFTLGTDAHRLIDIDTKTKLDEMKRILY